MSLDSYCTSIVPRPSFYRYYSFNSGLDESVSFKPGTPSEDDFLTIAYELGPLWKMFVRALKLPESVINKIDVDKPDVTEKCYCKCNRVVCIVIIG